MRPKATKQAPLLAAFIFKLSLFPSVSCKKIHNSDTAPPSQRTDTTGKDTIHVLPADLSVKVLASVSGFVLSGGEGAAEAVEGANISFGNKTTITDKYGYFE